MGALDFLKEFEGRALDAASYQLLRRNYELQEENNRQLKEKIEWLQDRLVGLKEQVKDLQAENKELSSKLDRQLVKKQFVIHQGFAFKRKPDGRFDPTGYCPNCNVVMSNMSPQSYQCPECKYIARCKTGPDVLALQLNAKTE